MALRQKRIIFVICPEPTDHGAGRPDAGFCIALYFTFFFFLSIELCTVVPEILRYYNSLSTRRIYSTLDEFCEPGTNQLTSRANKPPIYEIPSKFILQNKNRISNNAKLSPLYSKREYVLLF